MVREHASALAEEVWKFHTDAPVLAEINQAIVDGPAAVGVHGRLFWSLSH